MQNITGKESLVDWEIEALSRELYWWIDLFNIVFFRNTPIPIPILTFEKTRVTSSGFFKRRVEDSMVKDQINLNRLYLSRPLSETLQTLIHELVHSYELIYLPEDKTTKSWYHTKAFRAKLAEIGILVDEKGCHRVIGDPFVSLLKKHSVKFENTIRDTDGRLLIPSKPKTAGKSKLNKWSCGCQNARIGKAKFLATCDICQNRFMPAI